MVSSVREIGLEGCGAYQFQQIAQIAQRVNSYVLAPGALTHQDRRCLAVVVAAAKARGTRGLSTNLLVFTNECIVNKSLDDLALFLPKGATVMTNHLIDRDRQLIFRESIQCPAEMDTGFEQVHIDLGLMARKVFIHKLDDDVSRRGHDFPSIQDLRSLSRAVYLRVAYTRKPLVGGGRPRKPGGGTPRVGSARRAGRPPPPLCERCWVMSKHRYDPALWDLQGRKHREARMGRANECESAARTTSSGCQGTATILSDYGRIVAKRQGIW